MPLFKVNKENVDTKYTSKVNIPQYLPKAQKPNILSLYNSSKYGALIHDIENSNVSDEEKKFLKLAANRHIIFNYSQIADYYAHSNKEMQELMEQSALVILDINDAIANGYVKLSKNIAKIMEESGELANSDKG